MSHAETRQIQNSCRPCADTGTRWACRSRRGPDVADVGLTLCATSDRPIGSETIPPMSVIVDEIQLLMRSSRIPVLLRPRQRTGESNIGLIFLEGLSLSNTLEEGGSYQNQKNVFKKWFSQFQNAIMRLIWIVFREACDFGEMAINWKNRESVFLGVNDTSRIATEERRKCNEFLTNICCSGKKRNPETIGPLKASASASPHFRMRIALETVKTARKRLQRFHKFC